MFEYWWVLPLAVVVLLECVNIYLSWRLRSENARVKAASEAVQAKLIEVEALLLAHASTHHQVLEAYDRIKIHAKLLEMETVLSDHMTKH